MCAIVFNTAPSNGLISHLGVHMQIARIPALIATAHNEEDGCADNSHCDNSADRHDDGYIGRERLGPILFVCFT